MTRAGPMVTIGPVPAGRAAEIYDEFRARVTAACVEGKDAVGNLQNKRRPIKRRGKIRLKPESSDVEEELSLQDAEAVLFVKNELKLSEKEAAVLQKVLCKLKDDPLLVI
jgi:hypothetical protein